MINGSEPLKDLNPNINFNCLVAGPASGKTTILRGIEKASHYVSGFHCADMSEIMDWHKNPENLSPLRQQFERVNAQRASGVLVDDETTIIGLCAYIKQMSRKSLDEKGKPIEVMLLSGFPRTPKQKQMVLDNFSHHNFFYLDCPRVEADNRRLRRVGLGTHREDDEPERFKRRWDNFEQMIYPRVIKALQEEMLRRNMECFHTISHQSKLVCQALEVVDHMGLSQQALKSIRSNLINRGREAHDFLSGIVRRPTIVPREQGLIPALLSQAMSPLSQGLRA